MKSLCLIFCLLCSFYIHAQVFQGPITISKGGLYTGNYKSDDSNIPAITVSTYDPVEITGCIIVSSGIGIKAYGGTKMNIHNNTIKGQTPTGDKQYGRALDDYHPQWLIFEFNTVDHTGGIQVDHSDENTKSAVIRYNMFKNTDKRKADLNYGPEHRASILFNTVLPITGEISFNQFQNDLDSSAVEDNINFGNSGGTAGSPFLIHDNYIKGAYPYPFNAANYTGSGITVEGEPGHNQFTNVSQYVKILNNQVVSTCNGGININAGHDITAQFNRIVSSGLFPNGVQSNLFWGGAAIWNGSNVDGSVFKNISINNNTIGYARPGVNVPLPNRQDYVVVAGSPINIQPGDNIALPNPITLATEQNEWTLWQKKLADSGIVVGVGGKVNASGGNSVTVQAKLGQNAAGSLTPVNAKGEPVTYKQGSIQVTSGNTAIFTVATDANDETKIIVKSIKEGKATGTITLITNSGKMISQSFNVEILPADLIVDNEAVHISIVFSIIIVT